MTDNYKEFWEKFNTIDQSHKLYDIGDLNYELIVSLCFTKVNLDTFKCYSKFQNYNIDNSLKYINKTLKKFPKIWSYFDTPGYYNCLKDSNLRKKFLYELLNNLNK